MSGQQESLPRGPLAYMAGNRIAANLIMAVLILGGLLMLPTIKQEVFPEVTLDRVLISIPYPGASPEEVEQGVVLAAEEAVRGIDGIKEIQSVAGEGFGSVIAELYSGTDEDRALNDIKSAVDRITNFPRDAEEPAISLLVPLREVVSVILHGHLTPDRLREAANEVRDELLNDPGITQVRIEGLPAPQMTIEVPLENLRRYNLTLERIAAAVGNASVEIPGGAIETPTGEILLRTTERRHTADEFRTVAVIAGDSGTRVTIGDLGKVYEDYAEQDIEAYFQGERAVRITVYRVGDETPIQVSRAVHAYVAKKRALLSPKMGIEIWDDSSEIFEERIGLLLRNGAFGLLFVLIILGLFLKISHAFWVTVGMAASFCGSFLFMNWLGVTINMISLFAFILVLGIVVDDAIVIGESIFTRRRAGMGPYEASLAGVREVAVPVVFSVLTTVVAFAPILFVPGVTGKLFAVIPLIVIPILLLSLFESLFILPAHLAHHHRDRGIVAWLNGQQEKISRHLELWVERWYQPRLRLLVRHRHITIAASVAVLIIALGLVAGGIIRFVFFPKIEGDVVTATIELPFGSSVSQTRDVMERVIESARKTADSLEREIGTKLTTGIFSEVGGLRQSGGPIGNLQSSGANLAFVTVQLVPAGKRTLSARDFSRAWRQVTGGIAGVERLAFDYSIGPSAGAALAVELSHANAELLESAARRLAGEMGEFAGVFDIDDGYQRGKEQLDLELKPGARALGITEADLGRQIRGAYFGVEAVRQQRGREEMRVYVRLPRHQRASEYSLESMVIRTSRGGEIPLEQAAVISRGRSYTAINRENGRRVAEVTADVDPSVTNADQVFASLVETVLPEIKRDFPGLTYERAGQQQATMESLGSLRVNGLIALLVMYGLMAMVFQSYLQPIVVMSAIPFGIVGAFIGHLLMGYQLSMVSMLGIVALAGVVVNDSLVMIVAINDNRRAGMASFEAVIAGGMRRFRPVLLTSLTTFFGLAPMIFEQSLQAQFLIPMALSLGFGVLFVTVIALVIVPSGYLLIEDFAAFLAGRQAVDNKE